MGTDCENSRQFKAVFVKISPPTSLRDIERYLDFGMVKSIGLIYAERLMNAFGTAVFDVIGETPAKLREAESIGELDAKKTPQGWANQRRYLSVHLHSLSPLSRKLESANDYPQKPQPPKGNLCVTIEMMKIKVEEYLCENGDSPYQKWFDSLDVHAAAKVVTAKLRLEMGNTSSVKWFDGIGEYVIDWGPGYS